MNKEAKINEILQFWAEIYRSNPSFEVTDKHVYRHLVRFGVKPEEYSVNLRTQPSKSTQGAPQEFKDNMVVHPNSTFQKWMDTYSKDPRIACMCPEYWKYFCQFVSQDCQARNASEHLKIYIPLDAAHIEKGAKMIFDFLTENNISHMSKVGSEIRQDGFFVRLVNPVDLNKLIHFINNTPYIKEGLIDPNPFAFQRDGLALAVDGLLSYNATVATLIRTYMDKCREENTLDKVSCKDFYEYVRKLYKNQFLTHRSNELGQIFNWEDAETSKNYREVISLIIRSSSDDFTFEDYLQHYSTCANVEILTDAKIFETNRLLIEALQAMTMRFNTNGTDNVKLFYETGQARFITSRNQLRDRMVNNGFRKTLKAILNQRGMTFDEYVDLLLNQYHIDLDSLIQKSK